MDAGDIELPLVTAIATGNPCGGVDEYYAEPLDPASLDRFTLHVKADGLISSTCWDALKVIALNCGGRSRVEAKCEKQENITADIAKTLVEAHAALPDVTFGVELQHILVELLQAIVEEITSLSTPSSSSSSSGAVVSNLLTDRTFLAKGPLICRASALMQGRSNCNGEDLYAIRHLTAFRVPPEVHGRIEQIIETLITSARRRKERKDAGESSGGAVPQLSGGTEASPQPKAGRHAFPGQAPAAPQSQESQLGEQATLPWEEHNTPVHPRPSGRFSDLIMIPFLGVLDVMEVQIFSLHCEQC